MAEHLGGFNLKGFKKCRASSAVVVTGDDDILWNGGVEDGNVRSVYGGDEDTD